MPCRLAGGLPGISFDKAALLGQQTEGNVPISPKKESIPKATLIHKIHGPLRSTRRFAIMMILITLLSLALFRPASERHDASTASVDGGC